MNTKIKLILAGILVVVVVVAFILVRNILNDKQEESTMPSGQAVDFVLDFYDKWLSMGTSTDKYGEEVLNTSVFSDEVLNAIKTKRAESPNFDPVTCQTDIIPDRVRSRVFPVSATEAKVLVESRVGAETQTMMSFVTASVVKGAWKITNLECTAGDVAPEVEFNYDREGLLLKSVPPPFEAGKWHLVFEQDGQMGYVTPLFFSATSTCVSADGAESVCNPDNFTETARVRVKGGMTEVGAEVVRVEFQ